MKKLLNIAIIILVLMVPIISSAQKYHYETVEGDPMKTMIYTLPNGLKVYMSVNKDQPRIQTNIAVRVGSKNDPAETTGLAHYFEHMMFKGTEKFGTSDYAAEKPLLDEIEQLFEVYRLTTDSMARAQLYHQIDSVSYIASEIAIPNEYDKLMAAIGANGTNAYTSYDMTCYVEDIPSNELDRWARIQADRFAHPVLRGFHTELETIYEEKNMSLTKDSRKAIEVMLGTLFPNHPYGQWSVLGHQTHLKNPSITNIKKYHQTWYVPNNMAILMSGDFNPDDAIDIITKYFGDMEPNPNLTSLTDTPVIPITAPIKKEVLGNDAELLMIGWQFPGAADPSIETLEILDAMLNNGKAGIIDLDINKQQRALYMGTGMWNLADRSVYMVQAAPKEGQTLEELHAMILKEIQKLRNGDFDASLIPATINNYKLSQQQSIESNEGRVDLMENMFVNGISLQDAVSALDRQSKITKEQIVDFANKYLRDDNYVAVYKLKGKDDSQLKIAKQPITPIAVNRDKTSAFLADICADQPKPIEPVFIDFEKDLDYLTVNGNIPVLYKKNESNDLFQLTYVYDFGEANMPELYTASLYLPLLGTPDMTPEQISQKLYELACSYRLSTGNNRSYVTISGLSENMPKAIEIVEELMANAVPDKDTYEQGVARILKSRADNMDNQSSNFSALRDYLVYGPEQIKEMTPTNESLAAMDPKVVTDRIADMNGFEHSMIYYGPMEADEFTATINSLHRVPATLKPAPARKVYAKTQPEKTIFYIVPYDAKQIYMYEFTSEGKQFDPAIENTRKLYNEYFGGGMNSIVFQEMREARSLAYSASAYMGRPGYSNEPYTYGAMIATQNDKMETAVEGFEEIIENMPLSDNAFALAKSGIESRLRSERVIKDDIAWTLLDNRDHGIEGDTRKALFEALPGITLDDILVFQQENVKGRTYIIGILGDPDDLDLDALRRRGEVIILDKAEIFPY